jgi:hypothetical protein
MSSPLNHKALIAAVAIVTTTFVLAYACVRMYLRLIVLVYVCAYIFTFVLAYACVCMYLRLLVLV